MTFLVLLLIFVTSVIIFFLLLLGYFIQPPVWKKNLPKIKVFCILWFLPYFFFFFFFTGPVDLTEYPSQASAKYKLPWKAGISRFVSQGNRSFTSHRSLHFYAWDFVMPLGAEIVAARDGQVIEVEQGFSGIGLNANVICVQHADKEISCYAHIQKDGALVKKGDFVKSGQPIALNGMVGPTSLPHVHFVVFNSDRSASLPISFGDVPGGVPFAGRFYTSGNGVR